MKSIRGKIVLLVLLSVLVSAVAIGSISMYTIYQTNNDRINQLEDQLRQGYDTNIKHQVEIVVNELTGIMNQVDKGIITKSEAEVIAADVVRNAKYGTDGYFWADTREGINVVLLGREEVEGTSRIDLTDTNGNKIIQGFIALIDAEGEGYYDYYFPRPGETEALPKRGYVKLFEPFDWIIGTGNYIDDIDNTIAAEREAMQSQLNMAILTLLGGIAIALVIVITAAFIFSKSISKPILKLSEILNKTSNLDIVNDDTYDYLLKYKDETGVIANAVANLRVVL